MAVGSKLNPTVTRIQGNVKPNALAPVAGQEADSSIPTPIHFSFSRVHLLHIVRRKRLFPVLRQHLTRQPASPRESSSSPHCTASRRCRGANVRGWWGFRPAGGGAGVSLCLVTHGPTVQVYRDLSWGKVSHCHWGKLQLPASHRSGVGLEKRHTRVSDGSSQDLLR